MPYPRSISLNLRGKKTLLSISFQQDGLEKSTPDPVGHYHCFLLITINKFKKNKMKYLSISLIHDGLEESTPGTVGPHHQCFFLTTKSIPCSRSSAAPALSDL